MVMGWRSKLPGAGLVKVRVGAWLSINTPPDRAAEASVALASRNWALMDLRPSPAEVVNRSWVRPFGKGWNGCWLPKSLPSAMRYSVALTQPRSSKIACWSK